MMTSVLGPRGSVPAAVWAFGPHPPDPALRIATVEISEVVMVVLVVGPHVVGPVPAEKAEEKTHGVET